MSNPSQLGRYQVLDLLGRGGMGAVYKAHDPVLDRDVALKVVSPVVGNQPEEFIERFRREARAAGRLSHPGIVSVYDLDLDAATGTPFIVMEYVDGVSLATLLAENPRLPPKQALEIIEQVSAAVDEAHRNHIVHRDIKPGNVFLDSRGRVKVGDFGIARFEGSDLTQSGVSLGTPGYSAPEVVRGGIADARSDVFALGALAYQLVTGKRAFDGATREALALQAVETTPPPPSHVQSEVPEPVSVAVMHALAKSPADRTPSAAAFLRELRGDGGAPPTQTVLVPEAAAPVRGVRRVALAGLATALALALLVFALMRGCSGPPPPEIATPRASPGRAPAARPATPVPQAPAPTAGGWDRSGGNRDNAKDREDDDNDKGKGRGHGKKDHKPH
jgi:serine/threonine-protein kinase